MLTSSDFKELLKIFKKYKIRYLVVGGYAVMKYSEPRFTKDLAVLIADNWRRLLANSEPLRFRANAANGGRQWLSGM
jgi:hypothetical protein